VGGGWEKRKLHAKFWWREIKERDSFEDMDVDYKIILKTDIEETG
jgi:hypothetical protein